MFCDTFYSLLTESDVIYSTLVEVHTRIKSLTYANDDLNYIFVSSSGKLGKCQQVILHMIIQFILFSLLSTKQINELLGSLKESVTVWCPSPLRPDKR